MKIIDGRKVAGEILDELKQSILEIEGRKPGLAFILVGNHPASLTYVNAKEKACVKTGIVSTTLHLPENTSQATLIQEISRLNKDSAVDGILVQLPLPSHIDERSILQAISPEKDVDGFHPINLGKLALSDPTGLVPCTPQGIVFLLQKSEIGTRGKKVVIVGRSHIVGKPLALLLMQKSGAGDATVTVAHSQTKNLQEITLSADILIAAMGKAHFITASMVKKGAVVIDVGINRLKDRTLVGDVDFEKVKEVASYITPVPGGVGPMTIAMLLKNTLLSYKRRHGN